MNILVDAIPMTGLVTGICRHMRSLYGALEALPGADVSYFTGKQLLDKLPALPNSGKWIKATAAIWKLPDPVVTALRSFFWLNYERRLRSRCRARRYDVYHETAFVPAAVPRVPVVYSIYDLSLIKFRHMHPRERVWFYDLFWKRRKRYARHFFTSTEYTKSEAVEYFGIPQEKITAIPLAHSDEFRPRPADEIQAVLSAHGWPRDYLLFVGSLEPRKNLATLVAALERAGTDLPLVIVGWQGWGDKEWLEKIQSGRLRGRIMMAGYVDDDTLAALYSGAVGFIYPSLYEGFGLPILEAMACGAPVICSNTSSMPEVAGDAALLIDPADPSDLAQAIDRVAGDSELRAGLRRKGFARAAEFSWDRTARATMDVFRRVAGGE